MYSAQEMKNKFNMMANLMGDEGDDDDDQDSIKEAFLETNPYLLGLTFVVSIVHSVFEFLAFKNGKATIPHTSHIRCSYITIESDPITF